MAGKGLLVIGGVLLVRLHVDEGWVAVGGGTKLRRREVVVTRSSGDKKLRRPDLPIASSVVICF